MSHISNILALIWLDCAVIVDNEGIKFTFYPKKILAPSMISKWKTNLQIAFKFDLVHDDGFITEKPRRATGVEPAIPGIQTVCVSPPRHRSLAGDRRVNNSTSIALIFYRIEWGKTPPWLFNDCFCLTVVFDCSTAHISWIIVLFSNLKEWSEVAHSIPFPRITYHKFVMFLVMQNLCKICAKT